MPVDPEVQARVVGLSGVDPATLPPANDTAAAVDHALAALSPTSDAVEHAPVAVWTTGADGTVRTWNEAAQRLLGRPAANAVGRLPPIEGSEPPGAAPERRWARQPAGQVVAIDVTGHRHDTPDGEVVTVWFATPAVDAPGTGPAPGPGDEPDPDHDGDRWRRLLPCIADAVIVVNERGLITRVKSYAPEVLGHRTDDFTGSSGFALLDPTELERAWLVWERVLSDPGHEHRAVFRTRHADGHFEPVEYTAINLVGDPTVGGILMTSRLVTTLGASEALVSGEAEVLDLIARGAALPDTLAAVARIVETHTGGAAGILLLRPDAREFEIGTAGSVPVALLDLLRRAPVTPSLTFETIDFRRVTVIGDLGADHRTGPLGPTADDVNALGAGSAWSIPVIENGTDELLGLIAVFHRDQRPPSTYERRVGEAASHLAAIAVERHRWQHQLWHQARHDELTGLPNQASIIEHLDHVIASAHARGAGDPRSVAVVFVDVDRFKVVNDSYGHADGDKLLVRFAVRLRNLVGPHDFVGRFSADEFIIILDRVSDLADVRFVANRIDLALSEPFSLDEGEVYLTASIGVALSTGTESGTELIQHADAAMARAKDLGRDRMEIFDHFMRTQAEEHLRIDRQLRAAIEHGELRLHYQPIIDVRTGTTIGAEALLRWEHPTEGMLAPAHFLPVAEDTGTIVRIGRWVLDRAVSQAREWLDRQPHLEPFTISVNVSPRQLASPGLVEHVERTLDHHAWPADQLVLELTEGMLIEDRDAVVGVLRDLKALGVGLALDDFGTGFSSLNELHHFPLDAVKIHPSFVESLRADGSGSPVATAVLHMAHALGLLVVAEGVERSRQHAGLQILACDQAQGFHYARPAPPDELEATWMTAERPRAAGGTTP